MLFDDEGLYNALNQLRLNLAIWTLSDFTFWLDLSEVDFKSSQFNSV